VGDSQHQHNEHAVLNLIHNAVIAHTHAPRILFAVQIHYSRWTRISGQGVYKTRAMIWLDFAALLGQIDQDMANNTMDHGITHLYVTAFVAGQLPSLPPEIFEPSGLSARPGIYRVGRLFGKYDVYYTPKVLAQSVNLQTAEILDIMGDGPGCLRMLQALRNRSPRSPEAEEAAWRIQVRVKQRITRPPLKSTGPWPAGRQKWLKTATLLATGPAGELYIYQDDLDRAFLLKEGNLESVKEVLSRKARAAYLIGNASQAMFSAWSDVVACQRCADLREAVMKAWRDAQAGETVLLAPGCASFDQFSNFEDRGDQFLRIVESLQEEMKEVI